MSYQQISDLWDSKAAFGTGVHDLIENYLLSGNIRDDMTPEQSTCFTQFMAFWEQLQKRGIKCWRPEMRIFSEKYSIAGSIDLLVEFNDGTIELFDWKCLPVLRKTAYAYGFPPLQNFPDTNLAHYTIQLNLYKFILEEHYDVKIAAIHLVQLHHTLPTWNQVTLPDNRQSILDMLEFVADGQQEDERAAPPAKRKSPKSFFADDEA